MPHFVAEAPWSDEAGLEGTRTYALAALLSHGPRRAWIGDATGRPKRGPHAVGVARQYCGQLGETATCQVAVSLALANEVASLPTA